MLKNKDQVFNNFMERKAQVKNSSNKNLKTLRTDTGGEYVSNHFKAYLTKEGIRHELTVLKTQEQNRIAERLNRTLVESYYSICWMQNFLRRTGEKLFVLQFI